jgi:putative membrane protein
MKNIILSLMIITALAACNNNPSTPQEQPKADTGRQSNQNTAAGDRKFLSDAAEGSMMEVVMGQYASGHATDQRLKDYGVLVAVQQKQMLAQVRKMAEVRKVDLPDTVNDEHLKILLFLTPRGGNIFDSTYMSESIRHQKELSALYDDMIKTANDTELKTYASQTMPLIMNHLLRLITIRDSINIKKPLKR